MPNRMILVIIIVLPIVNSILDNLAFHVGNHDLFFLVWSLDDQLPMSEFQKFMWTTYLALAHPAGLSFCIIEKSATERYCLL